MYSRHIRHLATELSTRLFDREFLKRVGLTRRTMQGVFNRDKWESALDTIFPIRERFTCEKILELCRPEIAMLSPEPEEGWLSYAYKFSTHILYPDDEFTAASAPYAAGALLFLSILQFFFDEERKVMSFDPFDDFALLSEEEYKTFDRAHEYGHFMREFRRQYIYEMMRLNREATPFETLGHIAGVHHVRRRDEVNDGFGQLFQHGIQVAIVRDENNVVHILGIGSKGVFVDIVADTDHMDMDSIVACSITLKVR